MPRAINTEPCNVCGIVIRYKGDIARHQQLHKSDDAVPKNKCPYEGCSYQSLQKSNLSTHIRTHTGEKPNACPDCDFCTADPGCLTRHRKRKHGYVPIRKTAKIGPTTGTKQSRRHNPYQRNDKLASMASPSSSTSDNTFDDFDAFRAMTFSFPSASEAVCDEAQSVFSYSWDKSLFTSDVPSTLSGLDASEDFSSMLFKLSPGVDTCSQLHNGLDFSFDAMDLFPVQQQSQYFPAIYPADSSLEPSMFAPSAEVAWALNSEAFQAPTLYSLPEFPASSPNSSLSDLSSPLSFALLSPSPTDYTFTNLDVIH